MTQRPPDPRKLDVAQACADDLALSGQWPLQALERLADPESPPPPADAVVAWAARFGLRAGHGGAPQRWLALTADAALPRLCQRCLQPVAVALAVERRFRFAADEASAAALDEASEDDMLVESRRFDLQALVEDELLLALPLVPLHEVCPQPLALLPATPEPPGEAAPHPFAALAALKRGRQH